MNGDLIGNGIRLDYVKYFPNHTLLDSFDKTCAVVEDLNKFEVNSFLSFPVKVSSSNSNQNHIPPEITSCLTGAPQPSPNQSFD